MPSLEREWLNIAKNATSIDTVLKAGEVLYIPSHWFHYIISLQKSAQCNVRAGRHIQGSREFGGADDVKECVE
jgi:ribosomal protein L16 Arg81 hydroxylase